MAHPPAEVLVLNASYEPLHRVSVRHAITGSKSNTAYPTQVTSTSGQPGA